MGIRLDVGSIYSGAYVSPYFDSMLAKVTSHSLTFEDAARKVSRALSEFRVRGVKTNIGYLRNVLSHPEFLSGTATTDFIAKNASELLATQPRKNRATRVRGQRATWSRRQSPLNPTPSPISIKTAAQLPW